MSNMPNEDIGWRLRFQKFRHAFGLLAQALEGMSLNYFSDLERDGVFHRFEYTFDLSLKLWKDYLEFSGFNISSATSEEVIKECADIGLFSKAGLNPEIYISMMLTRNRISNAHEHTHEEEVYITDLTQIKEKYLLELKKQYLFFIEKERDNNA